MVSAAGYQTGSDLDAKPVQRVLSVDSPTGCSRQKRMSRERPLRARRGAPSTATRGRFADPPVGSVGSDRAVAAGALAQRILPLQAGVAATRLLRVGWNRGAAGPMWLRRSGARLRRLVGSRRKRCGAGRSMTRKTARRPTTARASLNGRAGRSNDGEPERRFSGLRSGFRSERTRRRSRADAGKASTTAATRDRPRSGCGSAPDRR